MNYEVTPWGGKRYRPVSEQMSSWEQFAEQVGLAREPLHVVRACLQEPVPPELVDYSQGLNAGLPADKAAGAIGVWLSATALEDLHQRDLDGATKNLLAIVDLIKFLRNCRRTTLQMLRALTGERGLNRTWEALQAEGWTDEQLAKLQAGWEKASVIDEFESAIEVERAIVLDEWDRELQRPMGQLVNWYNSNLFSWGDMSGLMRNAVWCLAWEQQDETRWVRRSKKGVDDVRAALNASKWIVARDRFKQTEREEWEIHWGLYNRWRYQTFLLAGYSWPENLVHEVKRVLEYETYREMTITAIALKRFELRHGKPPTDLATLVPEFLGRIPHDYMDGGSLRYRLNTDGTWTLYSVGEDGVDNGGDPRRTERGRLFYSVWDGRDAVWPSAAPHVDGETD